LISTGSTLVVVNTGFVDVTQTLEELKNDYAGYADFPEIVYLRPLEPKQIPSSAVLKKIVVVPNNDAVSLAAVLSASAKVALIIPSAKQVRDFAAGKGGLQPPDGFVHEVQQYSNADLESLLVQTGQQSLAAALTLLVPDFASSVKGGESSEQDAQVRPLDEGQILGQQVTRLEPHSLKLLQYFPVLVVEAKNSQVPDSVGGEENSKPQTDPLGNVAETTQTEAPTQAVPGQEGPFQFVEILKTAAERARALLTLVKDSLTSESMAVPTKSRSVVGIRRYNYNHSRLWN
jgi:hypothetical protein